MGSANGKASEVVFGIIAKDDAEVSNIPLSSKVTYDHVASRLGMMGVKASAKAIRQR